MNRKQMIQEISTQAHCSKRLVRKKLFELSARFKKCKRYKELKFNEAFLNKSTNWRDREKLYDEWKNGHISSREYWRSSNCFEVIYFPTGCNVMFYVDRIDKDMPEFINVDSCGVRLYNY